MIKQHKSKYLSNVARRNEVKSFSSDKNNLTVKQL